MERASHDLKSVITTYEGKHNHEVPPARNSSNVSSSTSVAFASQPQSFIQRHEPSQVTNMRLNSFNLPMMQQQQQPFIPHFPMGMNQAGLTNFSMDRLGPRESKYPGMHVHPYIMHQQQMQQRQGNDVEIPMPKMEHTSEPNLCISNGSSVYHQIMNRLPLGR